MKSFQKMVSFDEEIWLVTPALINMVILIARQCTFNSSNSSLQIIRNQLILNLIVCADFMIHRIEERGIPARSIQEMDILLSQVVLHNKIRCESMLLGIDLCI